MARQLLWMIGAVFLVTALLGSEARGNDTKSVKKLKVFSNQQKDDFGSSSDSFLPPFPVGLDIELMCQTVGRETYWYEQSDVATNSLPKRLETKQISTEGGVRVSVYQISPLEGGDDGRTLMCTMDGSTQKEDVELNVVDNANISVYTAVKGQIRCTGYSLAPDLEMCWFINGEKRECSGRKESDPSGATTVDLTVHINLEEESSNYTCRSQLKDEAAEEALSDDALKYYQRMFDDASKVLHVNSTVVDPKNCNANATNIENTSNSTVFYLNLENTPVCYSVSICEKRIKTSKSAPVAYGTTSTQAKIVDTTSDGIRALANTLLLTLLAIVAMVLC